MPYSQEKLERPSTKGYLYPKPTQVGEPATEAPVNGGRNYNGPKVAKFLVGLIFPKSSHRREGLAPRCRLFATWGCSMFQGLGCSPIKAVRELGSERRETVRSISGVGVRALRGPFPSTRGPGRTHLWCTSYRAHGKRWVAKCGADNC
ncbi:hypothetical protein FH972_025334 [Carpinus fangiana]|uniref:Uncharacterized protein n=1 Tax=Carpinus fangiana TaxID=176857 RepID=A0A5N6L135_9ROSI|nr:hypothetical protein FH972_025334 [Carpinus fangiana]